MSVSNRSLIVCLMSIEHAYGAVSRRIAEFRRCQDIQHAVESERWQERAVRALVNGKKEPYMDMAHMEPESSDNNE
jgi:hypothetical protein